MWKIYGKSWGKSSTGWWLTYPSEKWWSSSVGIMKFPTEWRNGKSSSIHVPNHQSVSTVVISYFGNEFQFQSSIHVPNTNQPLYPKSPMIFPTKSHASAWLIPKWSSHGFRGFTLWWFDAVGHGPGALADPGAKQNPTIQTMVTMAGWWLTYPCEKWWSESQLGWLFHSQLNGKIIQMFQTTNQPPFIVDLWRLNCPTFDCWLSSIWKTRRRMARERRGAESSILQDNILKMYDGRREE